ncbi:hypothetical protein D9758_007180 [Tetrapyrgos nigripes]|uniref:NADH:flavin oxidoreductase/NADH oxidase N-terminal domain-containing protein n=1 Tax=Tetrapyrgos nigripes TaxID=182062 RepID=A0A8H5D1S6_9AGAR|nr:hypothetical protein D9758_007180 [Tetrapyrgos nigripes]
MYEHLATFLGGPPNPYHFNLYSTWAKHGWGMIITGNVQVSDRHLSLGRDMVVPRCISKETLEPWKELANCIHGEKNKAKSKSNNAIGTLAIMQLNHAGRQSSNFLGGRAPFVSPLAPSAIRVGSTSKEPSLISEAVHRILFQTPRSMTEDDIDQVVDEFVKGAKLAEEAGFDGIQLHMAHGYLLAQFVSAKANKRTDSYSTSTPENALRLLRHIVLSIRAAVKRENFVLGIKFNTSDYSSSDENESKRMHEQEDIALGHICDIARWGNVDFIEISGGDYENPEFMISSKARSSRQAFFAHFSSRVMAVLHNFDAQDQSASSSHSKSNSKPLILLTGGLRTPEHIYTALASDHAHLLGFGRMSLLCPGLPTVLRQIEASDVGVGRYINPTTPSDMTPLHSLPEPDLTLSFTQQWPWSWLWTLIPKIKLVGAGVGMAWYIAAARVWATTRRSANENEDLKRQQMKENEAASDLYRMGPLEALVWMWIWTRAPELQQSPGLFMGLFLFALGVPVSFFGLYTLYNSFTLI